MKIRCTLSNGTLIEADHRDGIEAGLAFWDSNVLSLEFIDDDGNVVCDAEIPDEWEELEDRFDRIADRENVVRLADRW